MAKRKKEAVHSDRPTGYEILIGYIKEFTYVNEEASAHMNGHPIPGKCYRIIKDESGYRLHIGSENNDYQYDGLHLGSRLSAKKTFYSFKIEPVTPKNLLDLSLAKEDFAQVSSWLDTDNEDLWEKIKMEASRKAQASDLAQHIVDAIEAKAIEEEPIEITFKTTNYDQSKLLADSLNTIGDKDPKAFLAILDTLAYLASTYSDKYESKDMPNIGKFIVTQSDLGKGANVFNMIKYAQRYGTVGYEKSENIKDIFKVIHYALFEIQRRRFKAGTV